MEFALRAVRHILNIFDFDSKVISVILNFCCNLHTTGNIVPKINTLSQNIKEEFVLRAISQIDSKYI